MSKYLQFKLQTMTDAVIQETIDAIRKATKKAQQSKKAYVDFLVAAGISPILSKAPKKVIKATKK